MLYSILYHQSVPTIMKGHCTGAPFSTEEVCGPVKRSTVRLHAPSAERSAESMVPVTVTEVAVDSTTPDWLTRVSTHMVSLVGGHGLTV